MTSARGTGVGFAVATQPVSAQTIRTDKAGSVPLPDGELRRMRRSGASLRTTQPARAGA